MPRTWKDWLRILYVVLAFCCALFLGAMKGLLVGPVAGLILLIGNVGVILGLFPAHFYWTIYTIAKTDRFDTPLKIVVLLVLPALSALWVGLSVAGSAVLGVGYGFFAPWVSTFEAFRQENEVKKFLHLIVDGTWETIRGSCTVVRDFADICYHSYPQWLREIRESTSSDELQTIRFAHIPAIIAVGLMGLIVEIPSYTIIAVVKSPYMLFRGWQRLIQDLISREGPFLETACIPVAGLVIIFWPLIVAGSILMAIFSGVVVGLYGSYVAYEERSFRRGVAYVIAMVAEFDEYSNDFLYLRNGSILPKPRYRKKKLSHLAELAEAAGEKTVNGNKFGSAATREETPSMFVPSLAPSRSVKESIQEVKMVQVWGTMMRSCESRGKELIDANVITHSDLSDWSKQAAKSSLESFIIGVGLPSYSCFQSLLLSIKAGSDGFLLLDGGVVTWENKPKDRLSDWFFQPVMVLKEQIKAIKLTDEEVKYLEKVILFGSNGQQRAEAWKNGSVVPQEPVRAAQIQGIGRRLNGMIRNISKFPTYRRKYGRIVKALVAHVEGKGESTAHAMIESVRSVSSSIEIVVV